MTTHQIQSSTDDEVDFKDSGFHHDSSLQQVRFYFLDKAVNFPLSTHACARLIVAQKNEMTVRGYIFALVVRRQHTLHITLVAEKQARTAGVDLMKGSVLKSKVTRGLFV